VPSGRPVHGAPPLTSCPPFATRAQNKAGLAPERARKESSKAALKRARFDLETGAAATVPALVAAREAHSVAQARSTLRDEGAMAAEGEEEEEVEEDDEDMEDGEGEGVHGSFAGLDSDGQDMEGGGPTAGAKRSRGGALISGGGTYTPGASLDDLRERLRLRIASLKAIREGDPERAKRKALGAAAHAAAVTAAKEKVAKEVAKKEAPKAGEKAFKARPKSKAEARAPMIIAAQAAIAAGKARRAESLLPPGASYARIPAPAVPSAVLPASGDGLDIAFGTITTALPSALAAVTVSTQPALPGRDGGKQGKLRSLLADAQRYQKKLSALSSAGREGAAEKAQLEFGHALRRAEGEKVRDDPALLAKTLKRSAKGKAAGAAAWKDRKGKEEEEAGTRASARAENIKGKKNRALKKGDRPEKPKEGKEGQNRGRGGAGGSEGAAKGGAPSKKANRPGFEGRKSTFIA
jgi:hypothetical protein